MLRGWLGTPKLGSRCKPGHVSHFETHPYGFNLSHLLLLGLPVIPPVLLRLVHATSACFRCQLRVVVSPFFSRANCDLFCPQSQKRGPESLPNHFCETFLPNILARGHDLGTLRPVTKAQAWQHGIEALHLRSQLCNGLDVLGRLTDRAPKSPKFLGRGVGPQVPFEGDGNPRIFGRFPFFGGSAVKICHALVATSSQEASFRKKATDQGGAGFLKQFRGSNHRV